MPKHRTISVLPDRLFELDAYSEEGPSPAEYDNRLVEQFNALGDDRAGTALRLMGLTATRGYLSVTVENDLRRIASRCMDVVDHTRSPLSVVYYACLHSDDELFSDASVAVQKEIISLSESVDPEIERISELYSAAIALRQVSLRTLDIHALADVALLRAEIFGKGIYDCFEILFNLSIEPASDNSAILDKQFYERLFTEFKVRSTDKVWIEPDPSLELNPVDFASMVVHVSQCRNASQAKKIAQAMNRQLVLDFSC